MRPCRCSVFGYASNIWQPVDGDWNGSYSDVRHWSNGHLPDMNANGGGDKGEDAIFTCQDFDYTVTIDCVIGEDDVPLPQFFKIGYERDAGGGSGWVRFDGSGTVRQNQSGSQLIYPTNQVEFAGNLTIGSGWFSVNKGASLRFAENCATTNGTLTLYDGSTLEIAGGNLRTGLSFKEYESGSVRVTGGSVVLSTALSDEAIPPRCDFSFTGGRISVRAREVRTLFPARNGCSDEYDQLDRCDSGHQ